MPPNQRIASRVWEVPSGYSSTCLLCVRDPMHIWIVTDDTQFHLWLLKFPGSNLTNQDSEHENVAEDWSATQIKEIDYLL